MRALIEVRHDTPPHPIVADVDGFRVDRLLTLTGAGQFAFNVVASDVHRDVFREGRIVVIQSTTNVVPYVGVITQTSEDGDGIVEISGDNYASILYGMALDQSQAVSNTDAGAIAKRLLDNAQACGRSVFLTIGSAVGSPLIGSLDFGTQLLGQALDALAKRVGDEWWIEHVITRTQIRHYFFWGTRGIVRPDLLLQEGIDFTKTEYKRDALGRPRTTISVGGGGPAPDRTSFAVGSATSQPSAKASFADATRGVVSERSLGALVSRDVIEYRPLDTDPSILADSARRAYEHPVIANESIALTVTSAEWAHLSPGDSFTARFHSINYGGLVRVLRIKAMQPDESTGECDLAVEVQ